MLISVIIPTCNRNDLLSKCLELLSPLVQSIDNIYEVIVTDDSKNNQAKDLVEKNYSWATWVQGPKKGPAANRNNGADQAKGEWLVFIDDDCLPDEQLLNNYKNAIEKNKDCLAFEGAILPDDWSLLKRDLAECPVNTTGNCFWSANISINAKLFRQINGFDENYLIAAQEDQQIKLDIEKATDRKILFLKECIVVHPVRFTTVSKQLKKIPIASKNFIIYAIKNKEVLGYNSFTRFTLSQFKMHLVNTFKLIKTGKIKNSIVALAWLVYGVPMNAINYLRLRNSRKS